MLTEFGKLIRYYRIEHDIKMKDMAETLEVPPSYLSALEMGRKAVTDGFLKKLIEQYVFTEQEAQQLTTAAKDSATSVKINLINVSREKRELALDFARKFRDLDPETVNKLKKLIE